MNTVESNKRIHPHKFTLWVAMGSIIMMFAGLTSALIVKKNQANWLHFDLPLYFYYSTAILLASSVTIYLSQQSFIARRMLRYRQLISLTALLGVLFLVIQIMGFISLESANINLTGSNSNPSSSFLLVIAGLHMLHVAGGVIAILVIFVRAYISTTKNYSSLPIELVSTYWHFVDLLWVYLFIFLNLVR